MPTIISFLTLQAVGKMRSIQKFWKVVQDHACAPIQAQKYITGAKVLSDMDFTTTLAALKHVSKEDALTIARTALARLARSQPSDSRYHSCTRYRNFFTWQQVSQSQVAF